MSKKIEKQLSLSSAVSVDKNAIIATVEAAAISPYIVEIRQKWAKVKSKRRVTLIMLGFALFVSVVISFLFNAHDLHCPWLFFLPIGIALFIAWYYLSGNSPYHCSPFGYSWFQTFVQQVTDEVKKECNAKIIQIYADALHALFPSVAYDWSTCFANEELVTIVQNYAAFKSLVTTTSHKQLFSYYYDRWEWDAEDEGEAKTETKTFFPFEQYPDISIRAIILDEEHIDIFLVGDTVYLQTVPYDSSKVFDMVYCISKEESFNVAIRIDSPYNFGHMGLIDTVSHLFEAMPN